MPKQSFVFTVTQNTSRKTQSGNKKDIKVWQIVDNLPVFVGIETICTASYKGDIPTANNIISHNLGYEMRDGYYLMDNTIMVNQLY
jgi:hypothetical protein